MFHSYAQAHGTDGRGYNPRPALGDRHSVQLQSGTQQVQPATGAQETQMSNACAVLAIMFYSYVDISKPKESEMMAPCTPFSVGEHILSPFTSALIETIAAVHRGEKQQRALEAIALFANSVQKVYNDLPPEERWTPHTRVHDLLQSLLNEITFATFQANVIEDTSLHLTFSITKQGDGSFEIIP